MTDEEFNRYCAEVMLRTEYADEMPYPYSPATDINQMAEVFDKLVSGLLIKCHDPDAPENQLFEQFSVSMVSEGIALAMRQFIESTKEES